MLWAPNPAQFQYVSSIITIHNVAVNKNEEKIIFGVPGQAWSVKIILLTLEVLVSHILFIYLLKNSIMI